MTTEGEQQEAVCGTCGRKWRGFTSFGGDSRGVVKVCRDTPNRDGTWNYHPFIPAPVVHSDERCKCEHAISSHKSASDLDALYPGKAPHRRGHCSACCDPEDGGSDYCNHDYAPPTPSQDAESVRSDSDRPQRSLSQDAEGDGLEGARERVVEFFTPRLLALFEWDKDSPEFIEATALIGGALDDFESAIRKSYKPLMEAARDVWEAMPGELRSEAIDRMRAVALHIEESLGGSKDG